MLSKIIKRDMLPASIKLTELKNVFYKLLFATHLSFPVHFIILSGMSCRGSNMGKMEFKGDRLTRSGQGLPEEHLH